MRRPSIACRRAVHSLAPVPLQHVWISDDLLALAVNRFFRATCPHQRRHGSNVPGPLEARRRATKRGMTVQAAMSPSGGMMPPLFDFGALFGVRQRAEPSWRYEAPTLKTAEPLGLSHDEPQWPPYIEPPSIPILSPTSAISADFFPSAEARETLSRDQQEAKAPPKTHAARAQPVADAKSCFERFKKLLEPAATLSEHDRYKLLLDTCRACHSKKDDTGEFSLLVRRYLSASRNGRVPWANHHIVASLQTRTLRLPHIASSGAREMLRSLENMSSSSIDGIRGLRQLYKKYARQVAEDIDSPDSADQDANLQLLIRGLWDTGSFHHAPRSVQPRGDVIPAPVQELLQHLSQRLSDPCLRIHVCSIVSDPARAVSYVHSIVSNCTSNPNTRSILVRVLEHVPRRLLKTWMGHVHNKLLKFETKVPDMTMDSPHFEIWLRTLRLLDCKAPGASGPDLAFQALANLVKDHHSSATPPRAVAMALFHVLAGHQSMVGISPDRLTSLTRSSYATTRQRATDLCLSDMVAMVVLDLHEASLPNHGVLEVMVPLLDESAGLKPVLDLLKRVQSSGAALSETAFLEDYVTQVAHRLNQADRSSERKRQHLALALRTCQQIQRVVTYLGAEVDPQANALQGLQSRRKLQQILHRAQDAGILPLAFQNTTSNLSRATQTEIIHQFAHQYSLDRTRNHRQNWLSIYYLYRYMQQQRLEIGPLFTKAVLRACIIQPLSDNHFVSSRRLKWVCELVARVEGVDAARKVEYMFWVWRGDLILHATSVLKAAGVGGRARVSTMKRLGMI